MIKFGNLWSKPDCRESFYTAKRSKKLGNDNISVSKR